MEFFTLIEDSAVVTIEGE